MFERSLVQRRCFVLVWAIAGAVLLIWTYPVAAATALMEHSKHDFSFNSSYSGLHGLAGNEICKPCHVPHNAGKSDYLFRDFGQTWAAPSGHEVMLPESTLCMSCHDGTIAMPVGDPDSIASLNLTKDPHFWNDVLPGYGTVPANPNITPDLNTALTRVSGKWVAVNHRGGSTLTLPLYYTTDPDAPRMACTTCHDPHVEVVGTTGGYFLRSEQPYGELCVTCHTHFYPN